MSSLNLEQQRAVEHVHGPLLILAGAGSGKTRVLTHRIAHLIDQGVSPSRILAVTFTNKAAGEMRERVEKLVGSTDGMWVTTFHSAGLRILRDVGPHAGVPRDFVIYNDSDQQNIIKDILRELNIDDKKYTPRHFVTQISHAKDQLITSEALLASGDETYGLQTARVYELYQSQLLRARALDFADLLRLPVQIFREQPQILAKYQNRFKFIMIDEYQDTNFAQYQMVQLLAAGHRNLCVVGDPDQGVYGWRGADIQNILSFERDYKDTSVIRLEQNYRSTQVILEASNAVVARNKSRKEKALWSDRGDGELIHIRTHESDLDEAGWVARKIYKHHSDGGKYGDCAIFYRTNAQSRVFEESMRRAGIPYIIYGGTRFYERKEVKDMLAYLRILANPHDGVGIARIMNVPTRGIGKTTLQRLVDRAAREEISVFDALQRIDSYEEFQKGTKSKLSMITRLILELQEMANVATLTQLWETLLERTGYVQWLLDTSGPEGSERVTNIEELGRALSEASFDPTAEGNPLQQFLDQVALVSDIDSLDESQGVIKFMTLHLAKGLEFSHVFMVGMEEGLFPHARSLEDEEQLEEERRLCYVGMTRAQNKLFMSHSERRRLHGREQYNIPSRFLDEVPEKYVEWEKTNFATQRPVYQNHPAKTPNYKNFNSSPFSDDDFNDASSSDFAFDQSSPEDNGLRSGVRVAHPMFGPGTVRSSQGTGEKLKLTVQFDRVGQKTIMAAYANLNILS